ncbi:MAG TPA: pitrilysin family protein [Gemmatimonadales bacterium]|nr:pitrilysin family protein [Gemmatimonadales bacterium]
MNRQWTQDVVRTVLPNGLTLLAQRDASAPAVAVVTHVKAGFFDEPDRWVGISHVLEHMFFKGTPTRGVGQIARETKAAGGYLNASTSYDHTSYFAVLPARSLAAGIEVQADALKHPLIDPGELARELQVIIQEAKRKLDTPSAVAYETLHEVMFDRHRIRRWRIGYESQLAGFTRDDLWSYYASRYVPGRTIVSIVGDVPVDEMLALATRAYGDWQPAPAADDPSPEEPARQEIRARTLRGDVSQAELALGWRAVPPTHPDSPPLDLAAAVLGAGRGSWLYRALREPGIVTGIGAYNYAPTELGVFAITADLEPGRVAEAIDGVAEAAARLSLAGPSDAELDRARTLLLSRWMRRLEPMEGRASVLAAAEALGGFNELDREYAALVAATPSDVRVVAARYLSPESVSAVVYLPKERGDDLTADRLGRSFAVTQLRVLPTPNGSAPPPRPAAGTRAIGAVRAGTLHLALPGADLLLRRKPGVPAVTLGVYVPRIEPDPPRLAGLGALAVRTAVRGAGGLDAAGLAFAAERLGGTLTASVASDWLGFGTTVLADRAVDAAWLLRLLYTEPALADSEVLTERALMAAEASQVVDDMFRYPFQLAFRAAFGDHGYGLPASGLPETITEISPDDVRRWHGGRMLGARPAVIAVGDIDPERAADVLAGVFADLSTRSPEPIATAQSWALGGDPLERAATRDKAQSALAMVFRGPTRRSSERHAADVWAAVASGLGGRMFESLRDRRSLAYTVMASSWQKGRAGALVTYIATSPEREAEARSAMLDELGRFADEPVGESELSQAVNYLAGQAEVRQQNGSAVAGEVLEAWMIGDGLEELASPGAAYRAVSAAQVQAVASRYLVARERAEGVVRGTGGSR